VPARRSVVFFIVEFLRKLSHAYSLYPICWGK
jgi:hypothetical protein